MSSIRFIQAFVFALFFCQCLAQIGTNILSPETNATVSVGEKVQILYTYGNMGSGSYVVDLALWKDNAAEDLAQNIATNVAVKSGNSTGTKLEFTLNSTYEWTVPKGLADTVYLTVTTKPELESQVGLTMRSSPIRLHISAALTNLPIQKLSLLALAMGVLFFTC